MFIHGRRLLTTLLRPPSTIPTIPNLRSTFRRTMTISSQIPSTLPRTPLFSALVSHPPEKLAVIHPKPEDVTGAPENTFTYNSLLRDVQETKKKLLAQQGEGIHDLNGERVAMLVESKYDYIVSFLAILAAGGTCVPVCTTHPPAEQRYVIKDSAPTTLLTTPRFESRAQEIIAETPTKLYTLSLSASPSSSTTPTTTLSDLIDFDENRPALFIYTSGTTSLPKGVVHTHRSLAAQISGLLTSWKITSSDHLLHVLPLHHIHGIVVALLTPLSAGSTISFLPFNPTNVWNRLLLPETSDPARSPITLFMAVPTIYTRLLASKNPEPQSLPNIRLAISGSAALPASVRKRWDDITGAPLLERYGMSEIGMGLSQPLNPAERVGGTVGYPLPGVSAKIRPEDGELLISGDNVFESYWNRDDANATAWEPVFEGDEGKKWFKTGDIAECSADGVYTILGRASTDVLKTGGEKVSALEVEREMLELPQVKEVAVVGLPDEEWGQKVAAVVVLQDGVEGWTLEEMRREMKKRVAVQKVPSVLKLVGEIRRNAMGKINKKVLVKEVFPEN